MVMQDDCLVWQSSGNGGDCQKARRMRTDMANLPGNEGITGLRHIQTGAPDVPGLTLRVFMQTGNPFTGLELHTVQQAR